MESTSSTSSKSKPIGAFVVGGIIIFFIIIFFIKKVGTALLQKALENKTGVKTDLKNIEKGKLTFTDTKTGQTINVGGEKLPSDFPKDFPIYKGAKVIAVVSNSQQGKGNGFLVTFTTTDGLNKVVPFYKSGLIADGWTLSASFDSDTIQTWVVAKGTTEGSVSINAQKDQTTIQVALGIKK